MNVGDDIFSTLKVTSKEALKNEGLLFFGIFYKLKSVIRTTGETESS